MDDTGGTFLRVIACRVENLMQDQDFLDYEDREPADLMGDIPREEEEEEEEKAPADAQAASSGGALRRRGSEDAPASPRDGATYHDAVNPGELLRRRRKSSDLEEESSLTLFLRVRKMEHYSTALSQIGAKTISDLAFLTPQDLETVGIRPDDINNLTVNVVQ